MSELDAAKLLEALGDNYDQFKGHFNFNASLFLEDGEALIQENALPVIDLPLSVLEYLKFRKG